MSPLDGVTRSVSLIRAGGGLGIGAVVVGMLIFLASCAGFDAAFKLSVLPIALGTAGAILTIAGGARQTSPDASFVVAAMFPCALGIIGGLLEMAAWLNWTIFARQ